MTKDNHYGALDTWTSADCQSEDKTNAELRDEYFAKLRDQGSTMSSTEYAATCRAWHIFSLKARYEKGPVIKYVPGETKFKHGCTLTMRSSGDKD